ncbi:hypothetical protein LINGRAHAP2_LOCUS3000 [Linum grandiflorum]
MVRSEAEVEKKNVNRVNHKSHLSFPRTNHFVRLPRSSDATQPLSRRNYQVS